LRPGGRCIRDGGHRCCLVGRTGPAERGVGQHTQETDGDDSHAGHDDLPESLLLEQITQGSTPGFLIRRWRRSLF
jgi:hypothetical protein